MSKNMGHKMVNFWPKSKAIGLVFCQNLIQNRLDHFISKNLGHKNGQFLAKKLGYRLGFLPKIDPK